MADCWPADSWPLSWATDRLPMPAIRAHRTNTAAQASATLDFMVFKFWSPKESDVDLRAFTLGVFTRGEFQRSVKLVILERGDPAPAGEGFVIRLADL